jgi:hypothetical protein
LLISVLLLGCLYVNGNDFVNASSGAKILKKTAEKGKEIVGDTLMFLMKYQSLCEKE